MSFTSSCVIITAYEIFDNHNHIHVDRQTQWMRLALALVFTLPLFMQGCVDERKPTMLGQVEKVIRKETLYSCTWAGVK